MTGTTNRYLICEKDHTKFGGSIFLSDFNTDYRRKDSPNGSSIASRIINDWNFDKRCQKNIENNNRENIGRNKNG